MHSCNRVVIDGSWITQSRFHALIATKWSAFTVLRETVMGFAPASFAIEETLAPAGVSTHALMTTILTITTTLRVRGRTGIG